MPYVSPKEKELNDWMERECRYISRRFSAKSMQGMFDTDDAFVVALAAMHKVKGRSTDKEWLRACARNAVRDEIERLKPRGDLAYPKSIDTPEGEELCADIPDPRDSIAEHLTATEIDTLLARVQPPNYAKILRLYLVDGLTYEECAAPMGLKGRDGAWHLCQRALTVLRELVAADAEQGVGIGVGVAPGVELARAA